MSKKIRINRFGISLLACLIINLFGFGQQPQSDSLKTIINSSQSKDQEKLNALIKLCETQIYSASSEENLNYCSQMKTLAAKLSEPIHQNTARLYLADVYMRKQNFEMAKKNAAEVVESNQSTEGYLRGINSLGRVYHHFQKYSQAIETYAKGIHRYTQNPTCKLVCTIYLNMGISYNRLNENEKEMQCYITGLSIAEDLGDFDSKYFAYYTIACAYRDLEQYELSEKYFTEGIVFANDQMNDHYSNAYKHGMAILYSRWGKYDKALENNFSALEYYTNQGNELYEFDVLNNLAVLYSRMDSIRTSIEYGKLALVKAEKLNHNLAIIGAKLTLSSSYIEIDEFDKAEQLCKEVEPFMDNRSYMSILSKEQLLENLTVIKQKKGAFEEALSYSQQSADLSDSIKNNERFTTVINLEKKYHSEKKDGVLKKQETEIKQQKKINRVIAESNSNYITIAILALLSVAIAVFIMFHFKNRYQREVNNVKVLVNELNAKQNLQEQPTNDYYEVFREMLRKKYNLTPALLEYWLLQVEGLKEVVMAHELEKRNGYAITPDAINKRRTRLYSALKVKEGIDQEIEMKRYKSVGIYHKNLKRYLESL